MTHPTVDPDRHAAAARPAGVHLLVDLHGAEGLDDANVIDGVLRRSAAAAGASVLSSHLHAFAPTGGVTGVVILAESHISIHTWPEHSYAALDLFMCGDADPHRAIPLLRKAFRPDRVEVTEHLRG